MNYVDNLLDEINQKASARQIQIIEGLFDRVSSSMYGLKNLNHYVDLKLDLHRINKQLNFLETIGATTGLWYDNCGNICSGASEELLNLMTKQHKLKVKLYNSKLKAKGIRTLRKEILQELNK